MEKKKNDNISKATPFLKVKRILSIGMLSLGLAWFAVAVSVDMPRASKYAHAYGGTALASAGMALAVFEPSQEDENGDVDDFDECEKKECALSKDDLQKIMKESAMEDQLGIGD